MANPNQCCSHTGFIHDRVVPSRPCRLKRLSPCSDGCTFTRLCALLTKFHPLLDSAECMGVGNTAVTHQPRRRIFPLGQSQFSSGTQQPPKALPCFLKTAFSPAEGRQAAGENRRGRLPALRPASALSPPLAVRNPPPQH